MSAQVSHAETSNDEQAIRQLVARFLEASKANDVDTVLSLLADDVVFMVPGVEPFGKEAFTASAEKNRDSFIDGTSEIKEIKVLGDWAWMRNYLDITVRSPKGEEKRRSGYTLTILRKNQNGQWVISRDANLLTPKNNT